MSFDAKWGIDRYWGDRFEKQHHTKPFSGLTWRDISRALSSKANSAKRHINVLIGGTEEIIRHKMTLLGTGLTKMVCGSSSPMPDSDGLSPNPTVECTTITENAQACKQKAKNHTAEAHHEEAFTLMCMLQLSVLQQGAQVRFCCTFRVYNKWSLGGSRILSRPTIYTPRLHFSPPIDGVLYAVRSPACTCLRMQMYTPSPTLKNSSKICTVILGSTCPQSRGSLGHFANCFPYPL